MAIDGGEGGDAAAPPGPPGVQRVAATIVHEHVGQELRASLLRQIQQTQGNRCAQTVVSRARRIQRSTPARVAGHAPSSVQRVEITPTVTRPHRTILQSYEQSHPETPTATYQPNVYDAHPVSFDMTRSGNQVIVNVRILFTTENDEAIPSPDPSGRRAFATSQCTNLAAVWNRRFHLHGTGSAPATPATTQGGPATGAPTTAEGGSTAGTDVNLDLVFRATPIFDSSQTHDATVKIHAQTAWATPTDVVNAGNWYTQLPASDQAFQDAIYAHEYGHLLGLRDEYSQSNQQMHERFHEVSPRDATQMGQALDEASTRRLTTAALTPQIAPVVDNISREVAILVQTQQLKILTDLVQTLRAAWNDESVVGPVVTTLQSMFSRELLPDARATLTGMRANAVSADRVNAVVAAETNTASMATLIRTTLSAAVRTMERNDRRVTIPYNGNTQQMVVEIETRGVSENAALNQAARDAMQAAAGEPAPRARGGGTGGEGTGSTGSGTGGTGGGATGGEAAPATPMPSTLIGQLEELVTVWQDIASLFGREAAQINSDVLAAAQTYLALALRTTASNADQIPPIITGMLTNSSLTAATAALRRFVSSQIQPLVNQMFTGVVNAVTAQVNALASGGAGSAATAAPGENAELRASARTMAEQIRGMLGTATSDPGHSIRYTVESLMGQNRASREIRMEQIEQTQIAAFFNDARYVPQLRHNNESTFEMRSGPAPAAPTGTTPPGPTSTGMGGPGTRPPTLPPEL